MTQTEAPSPLQYHTPTQVGSASDTRRLVGRGLSLVTAVLVATTLVLAAVRTPVGADLDVPIIACVIGALAVIATLAVRAVDVTKREGLFEAVISVLSGMEWLCLGLFCSLLVIALLRTYRLSFGADSDGFALDWPWIAIALAAASGWAIFVMLKALLSGDAGIVLKQMRQRALGTWLTLLSVLLGVALAVAVLLINRESGKLFGQTDFGYELIIGPPKGSQLTLTLNTVYHMEQSEGVVPYSLYEELSTPDTNLNKQGVRAAVPFMVGDSYKGRRIVGTSPQMIGYDDAGNRSARPWEYRRGRSYELAAGKPFHARRFEAVIGSEVARELGLNLFDPNLPVDPNLKGRDREEALDKANEARKAVFQATHGMPQPGEIPDIHKPKWRIVGILKPTGTANDRVLFVPVISLYAIEEHSWGMLVQKLLQRGYNPNTITQDRLTEILPKLGFEPSKIPPAVWKKFRKGDPAPDTQPASTQPATAQSASATMPSELRKADDSGGDLLRDSSPKPVEKKDAKDDEDEDAYKLDAEGNILPELPQDEWAVSAILVKTRSPFMAEQLLYTFKVINTDAQAASPARVMRGFFDTFMKGITQVLLIVAGLVSIVAAISILVSIYNSVSARQKEIAILRALGATRGKVLRLICLEAGLVGLLGGSLGLLAGHLLGAGGNTLLEKVLGEGIAWWEVDRNELLYLAAVTLVAVLAGLIPALKAYRVPVVANLTGG